MKKILFFLLAFFLLISANFAFAIDYETAANTAPTGYVSDFANALKDKGKIESEITELEKSTTAEIAVVIIDQLPETHTIDDFAVELFKEWGIGKKAKDNGLMFLISINDRKFRIEVGYGLEGTVTDLTASRIAEKNFPNNFRNGDYDQGILDAIRDTKGLIEKDQKIIDEYAKNNNKSVSGIIFTAIALITWAIIATIFINMPWLLASHGAGSFMSVFMVGWPFLPVYIIVALFAWIMKYSPPSSSGGSGYKSSRSYSSSSSSWGGGSSSGGFGGFGGGISGGGGYSGGW